MSISPGAIQFEHLGIGHALAHHRLKVPVNQREYSWEDEQVKELIDDLYRTIGQGAYFLGTIVLTPGKGDTLEVADGQQRLATVTILLAGIRDYFHAQGDAFNVNSIEAEFLLINDRTARQQVPRLGLNVDDNEFFRQAIIAGPDAAERKKIKPQRDSHKFILAAQKQAAKHVQLLTRSRSGQAVTEVLLNWVEFIAKGAQVILLTVPDHLNAFRMFETLNDRGVKTSQADLLKNYLFGEAGERIPEAQHKWSEMSGMLEATGADDIVLTYLRHLLVAKHGATREREVYDKIKSTVTGPFPSIEFLDDLADNANYYAALLSHKHPLWSTYGSFTTKLRRHVETLNELRVVQIRPLMLACLKSFAPADTEKAFRLFISWAVRFMIAGSPTGAVEKYYAGRASEVWRGEIATAEELARSMSKNVPDDEAFQAAFCGVRIHKGHIARYLLRALESKLQRDPEPEWIVNDDATMLTVEHVLPQNPSEDWPKIDEDLAPALHRRLGNLVLLRSSVNCDLGNKGFDVKKSVYKDMATLATTLQVLDYDKWGKEEIDDRQGKLADMAVEVWSLKIR